MEAGALNCPSCGASVSDDSTNCLYCSAMLQTVACPSCFGRMFLGTRFCPHCGVPADAPRKREDTGHLCPRCQGNLQAITVGHAPLEQCDACGGLWVDSGTFDKICSDREAQTAALGLNLPAPGGLEPEVRYLKCPCCPGLMNRVCYANGSGVVIDICRQHGIWLDRDELRRIIEFIRAGGLDVARRDEIERLERERQQLEFERHTSASLNWPDQHKAQRGEEMLSGIAAAIGWLLK